MEDVLIIGAGPAGAVAAVVLARAGVRVRLLDRAQFPRHKLCGDTVNPGALAVLRRLGIAGDVEQRGGRVDGMMVTRGPGMSIEGRYPDQLHGVVLTRHELDRMLLSAADAAGAAIECGTLVQGPLVTEGRTTPLVTGVTVTGHHGSTTLQAPVTIAADGRRSVLTFGLGLSRHPPRPRRWAIGGYFEGAQGCRSTFGEMHIRRGHYIGIAPIDHALTNACLVKPLAPGELHDAALLLTGALAADSMLRDRFAGARLVGPPMVLGPLAVDVTGRSIDGLLCAGDAAGFIDPMTGDGLRFAIRGGELAAAAALEALEHGWNGVHARLARARRQEFGTKWRLNRTLRALVDRPQAVSASAVVARIVPGIVSRLVARAGDCGSAIAHPHIADTIFPDVC